MKRFIGLVLLTVIMLNISVLSVSAAEITNFCSKHGEYNGITCLGCKTEASISTCSKHGGYTGATCPDCKAASGNEDSLTLDKPDYRTADERFYGVGPKGKVTEPPKEYTQAPRELVAKLVIQPITVLAPSRR